MTLMIACQWEQACKLQRTIVDLPAISIGRLFFLPEIDPIVEQVKGSMTAVEVLFRGFDREPDPVHEKQAEEDCHSKAEIPLEQSWVVDVRYHSEDHADRGEKP